MSATAFLFGGQGIDPPWITRDLVDRAAARPLIEAASAAAGHDVRALLVRGGAALASTAVYQPALVTACLIAVDALADAGVVPDVVCGHSLGELAAWAAAGHVAATDAITAAAMRGRLMAREAERHPGGMAAVATGELDRVLAIGCSHGPLVVAGYNTPAETTVSGAVAAIAAVVAAGGRRLSVQGAWHSAAMAGAVAELHAALAAVPRRAGGVPLISNRDGRAAAAAEVPGRLADQLVHPVQWIACLRALAARGVTRYVVVGPGRLVRALVRATLGAVDVQIADGTRAVGSAVAA